MSISGQIGSQPNAHLISSSSPISSYPTSSSSSSSSGLGSQSLYPVASAVPTAVELNNLETLDEPVSTTILRDLRRVAIKLKHVLIPKDTVKELRDWDLWGPLLLCLLLATTLSISAVHDQSALIFTAVFVIVWVGAGIITLNAALLGGQISVLQSVCVLGYCLAPLNVASILCFIWANKYYHFVLVAIAFVWSTRASVGFMAQLMPDAKRTLGVYPVLLFYLTISWMILVQ